MSTSTFIQTARGAQTLTDYFSHLDGDIEVLSKVGDAFAPHEQATPNMTIALDAGVIVSGTALDNVPAQSTTTITAPSSNPRLDLVIVDQADGSVSVITGTEAPMPDLPALSGGKIPVASVALSPSTTAITNSLITDLRPLFRQEALAGGTLVRGPNGLALSNTAVAPGSYTLTNLTVDQQGRITAASNGTAVTQVDTGTGLTGGPITGTGTISLTNTGVTAGSYTLSNLTIDAQGRITAASNGSAVTSFDGRTGAVTLNAGDITTALGFTPAPINSPAFTGSPTAPTPAPGDNSTNIATTAFVQNATASAAGDGSAAALYQLGLMM